jgi:hypothetical protein
MHKRILCLGLISTFLFACSSDNGTGDAGGDAATDATSGQDGSTDAGGGDTGPGDAAPSDGATSDAADSGTVVDITCTNPTQCDAGAALCCGTIVLSGGSPPACDVSSITTTCAAQCATMLPFSCTGTDTVRLCNQNTDCTEQGYDKCCTFQTGGQSVTFCANQGIATSAGATCL